jgi:hypothetical protein
MYWVQQRLDIRKEQAAALEKIKSGTEPMWTSLCEAVKDSIAFYYEANKFGRFETDGKNHHVLWVRYLEDTPNHNTEKKKVTITLDSSARTITATYKGIKFEPRELRLDLNGDAVCLRNEAEDALRSADAVVYFLEPFLFTDLVQTASQQGSIYAKRGVRSI